MQISRALIVFFFCVMFGHAQATKPDQALLKEAREKYDAPFNRNLESFNCAVNFNWKEHFTETPRVGDEGTDEEFEKLIQPIRNRVTVTRQNAIVSSGLTEDEINKFPYKGIAEGLLEHAVQKSFFSWLPASTNMILPPLATPVSFERSNSGYKLAFEMQTADVDMRLQNATLKGPQYSSISKHHSRLGRRGSS